LYSDGYETGSPCDLYYADMDDWGYKNGNVYVTYDAANVFRGGNFSPEMFFGRICAGGISSSITDEAEKTAKYLDKIHAYRINEGNLDSAQMNRALVFKYGNDYNSKFVLGWEEREICKHIKAYCDPDATNVPNYLSEIQEGYRFVKFMNHSGSYMGDMGVSTDMLRLIQPKFNFMNYWGCSGCTYTVENLGAVYLFDNDYSLNVIGSTGGWSIAPDYDFFSALRDGVPVGIALMEYIHRNIPVEEGWPKGVLLGDPLIRYPAVLKNKAPVVYNDFRELTAEVGSNTRVLVQPSDPEMEKCSVRFVGLPGNAAFRDTFLNWTPTEEFSDINMPFEYVATDPGGNTFSEVFCIKVKAMNPRELRNGDFESALGKYLYGWNGSSHAMYYRDSLLTGIDNSRSLCIHNPAPHDVFVYQEVKLRPNTEYILDGWIRGENIVLCQGMTGASLVVYDADKPDYYNGITLESLCGTFDWTRVSTKFLTGKTGNVVVACRLGFFCSLVTGKAWFDNISIHQEGTTEINNPLDDEILWISPNPVSDMINLKYSSEGAWPAVVSILDNAGRCVSRETFQSQAGLNTVQFYPGHLNEGFFIVKIDLPGKSIVGKLVVSRAGL
jgi:hypothetical protein